MSGDLMKLDRSAPYTQPVRDATLVYLKSMTLISENRVEVELKWPAQPTSFAYFGRKGPGPVPRLNNILSETSSARGYLIRSTRGVGRERYT